MTASFSAKSAPGPSGARVAAIVVGGVLAAMAVLALVTAGATFFGLAIAFPIAMPIVEQLGLIVPATDAAIAEHFAAAWPAFIALGVASFGGAILVVMATVRALSPDSRA